MMRNDAPVMLREFMGLPLPIDDFGTGYARLSQPQQLHVDAIKTDKSFVKASGIRYRQVLVRVTAIREAGKRHQRARF